MNIKCLDCTLRDGAYIVNGQFGKANIRGIVEKLDLARIEIIEVGWLKNDEHKLGSSYYRTPDDFKQYLNHKNKNVIYSAMVDYNRYDLKYLIDYDGNSIDCIRIVFPYGKCEEAIQLGEGIRAKGYKVYFQLANTLNYDNDDLKDVVGAMNRFRPDGIYMVDTFGAMFDDDVIRIAKCINENLDVDIEFGIHTHNNQQLAFSNVMIFIKTICDSKVDRNIVVDCSLCGMGRGAGNATTELMTSYLNRKYDKHYDLDEIMDAIDTYMGYFIERYKWGYSTPYFIAGIYTTHVNNIAYLIDNHNTNAKDMRNIIESMGKNERKAYDYDYLENKYIENQNKQIDDIDNINKLKQDFDKKKILLIAPGRTSLDKKDEIQRFIKENKVVIIGVNSILDDYNYDYIIFVNKNRYEYCKNAHKNMFEQTKKILLSNIKTESSDNEIIVSFNKAIKRGFMHFDNAVIVSLRLLDYLGVNEVYLAGFDGFKERYNESYADPYLPSLNIGNKWEDLNDEIRLMFNDILKNKKNINIKFLTESIFCE